jgi:hypothetical protein
MQGAAGEFRGYTLEPEHSIVFFDETITDK